MGKKENEAQLDQFNQTLRGNADYQAYLQSLGVRTDVQPGQAWRLSDNQRKSAASWVTDRYGDLGKGMEIDISGNVNQDEGFTKQAKTWGPIIAAGLGTALTAGGASPWLASAIGGGLGSSTGALGGGGLKGALIGGALGAAPGAIGGLTRGAGSGLGGLYAATPGNITSQGVSAGIGASTGAGMTLGGLPWDKIIGAAGSALSNSSQAKASNRGEKFGGQMDLEEMLLMRERQLQDMQIAREQEGRASGGNAWRRLLAAQHALNPESAPAGSSPYNTPMRGPTAAERQGAEAMTQEVMARLTGGNPIPQATQHPMTVDPRLLDPSSMESILGWLGAGGTMYGALGRLGNGEPLQRRVSFSQDNTGRNG